MKTSDSQSEQLDMMDIAGSIKLDIMGGLIKLKGSASYANTESSSSRSSSVTLKSSKTSRTEALSGESSNHEGHKEISHLMRHMLR